MKNLMAIIMLSMLVLASCSKSGGGSGSEETATENVASNTNTNPTTPAPEEPAPTPTTPTDPGPVSNLPSAAHTFSTKITKFNFSDSQEEKYDEAIALVKLVVATEEFRTKVLNHKYNGKTQYADNKGRTNAQIYQTILDGAESLQPTKNNRMDLEVELYYAGNSTVGYTYPSSKRIWVNTKFFSQYDAHSVAGNLFHEWLHKLGYTHDASVTAKRPYTVPYAIGYIMRDIAKKFL